MTFGGVVAAIDCGTNSTRLLIVDGEGSALVREMHITRLGEGVDATQELSDEAIARTLAVLRAFRTTMDEQHVVRSRLVATSAVRDARNGDTFLRSAADVIGTPAELLPGEEEGRLSYVGATAGLPGGGGDDLVVDIGGGSTELVTERDGQIHAISLKLGCVRLTEHYFGHDPPNQAEVSATVHAIHTELDRAVTALPVLTTLRPESRLIGLAGTVSTLAALELGLRAYTRERLHHVRIMRTSVEKWCETLMAESSADRALRAGMLEGRQDVIVGGALVLREGISRFGFHDCLVSESDILDGLVDSMRR
jgi:exopolyphosphatase/guanosine-5'-triphosphate,3'-diphosphate pyrophosphatase